jgi:FkbM family methyltransferase
MTSYGKLSLFDWVVYLANSTVMACIKQLSPNKEGHFNTWSGRLSKYFPKLVGRTYFGAAIECELRDYIPKRIFFFGVWEPEISRVISGELRPGDVFVDIGANVGYDTLLGSKSVGRNGHVVAIEASSDIFQRLQRNLTRNGVANVRTVAVAVSDCEGELVLYAERGNLGRTSSLNRAGSQPVESVPMLPLDRILTEDERRRVRLIKIDIEGGELPLLERLVETLDLYSRDMRLLVEMSEDETGRASVVFAALLGHGFSAYAVRNDYALRSYLQPNAASAPERITRLPDTQIDILFKREF